MDTFVISSSDSDFSPLVSKLRENNKMVSGVGAKHSSSDLLIANCDELIYYDDLVKRKPSPAKAATGKVGTAKTWSKKATKNKADGEDRKHEAWDLLEEAKKRGILELERGEKSGGFIVKG